ncbi:phosphotransferase [Streptomyces flavotricini]|uniref:Phosphotransferase n=1 Tax=Streptomyces flavotricini TaxID=66888 RepID=A0ABS8E2U0_9ACTN|nr:phosphotransferase [Streptomyces flavotricini]
MAVGTVHDEEQQNEFVAEVLELRYGLSADGIERVPPTDLGAVINRRVLTSGGDRVYIKEYPGGGTLHEVRAALDMAQFCFAAQLPVPRVWPDESGDVLSEFGGSAWAVVSEAPGRISPHVMSGPQAEHIGMVLGRMHRVLAAYPLPQSSQPRRWSSHPVEGALAECDALLRRLPAQLLNGPTSLRTDLAQRADDLRGEAERLRSGVPRDLVEHAIHGGFTPRHVLLVTDVVTGVIGFRCQSGMPAWELGRIALDPRTVAGNDEWLGGVIALVSAYRSENPTLPVRDITASARIALLHMLFSFGGAKTTTCCTSLEADGLRHRWADQQAAIRRVLTSLDDLEEALRSTPGHSPGTRR